MLLYNLSIESYRFSLYEKALEEVFWYRLRNKTGRISAGLENIGQDLANGFKLIENEVEDVQRDVKVHWEILSDKLAKFQVKKN